MQCCCSHQHWEIQIPWRWGLIVPYLEWTKNLKGSVVGITKERALWHVPFIDMTQSSVVNDMIPHLKKGKAQHSKSVYWKVTSL